MKYAEIKELTTEEIKANIVSSKMNLTKMKFSHALSALENPLKINALRKDIARLNTELTKRQKAVVAQQ